MTSSPLLLLPSCSSRAPSSAVSSVQTVRWASITAYAIPDLTCFSPPPPPMSAEQLQQVQVQKQQSRLEDQVRLEQSQRIRQQAELQLQLSRHRNAILEQQSKQQQLYEQDLQERRRQLQLQLERQQQQQVKKHEKEEKDEQQLHQDTTVSMAPHTNSSRQGEQGHDDLQYGMTCSDASLAQEEEEPCSKFVATRHRTMFGYRSPEHIRDAEAILQEDMEALQLEQDERAWTVAVSTSPLSSMLPAEIRVQLAMMDYTPKHIDAMTLEEAQAILQPASPSTAATNTHTSASASISTPLTEDTLSAPGIVTVPAPSKEESLSPVMEARPPLRYPTDGGNGRYLQ
ncbi:hypothetical protein EMPS_00548 [Entomortierella parvispora]|uniref:Uncharacterized protein n=1 Tax=Entomortierella parvispora TaxID=205924 RepID=A0A9P3H1A8_9FUNG|nr:hypothetical protein EMPS_00548 [Entomortierella parvispora]